MTSLPQGILNHPQTPSVQLISPPIRLAVEQLVSSYIGRKWQAKTFQDLIDLASHPCGILAGEGYAVFTKLSRAANGLDQFEVEMAGLRLLAARAGVMVPTPIGIVPVNEGNVLVMQAVQAVERSSAQWRDIGRTLARIHAVKGDYFGFDQQGYFGPTYQDNRPMSTWLNFYAERRLWPSLTAAINAGRLSSALIHKVEKLIARLPDLDIPDCQPALLHGDAQGNNYISTPAGAMAIDPAVFYGSPEFDLAHLGTFQPVPQDVFEGYQELLPIESGFFDRLELWRVAAYLLCVALEGESYMPQLTAAVDKFI